MGARGFFWGAGGFLKIAQPFRAGGMGAGCVSPGRDGRGFFRPCRDSCFGVAWDPALKGWAIFALLRCGAGYALRSFGFWRGERLCESALERFKFGAPDVGSHARYDLAPVRWG